MRYVTRHPAVQRTASALLLVSTGVIIGTYAPAAGSSGGGGPAGDGGAGHDANASATPSAPPVPVPAPVPDTAAGEAGVPPAPGYESFLAGSPRPEFGGEYAVLRGAQTAGDPVPRATPPPPPASIPSAPAAAVGEEGAAAGLDSAAAPSASPAPESYRPSPAQGIPRGIALRTPLLAMARSGGRVAFHDLGLRDGPAPAGIEGEWAVIGRCDRPLRLEFALPARRAGELRAIGRAGASAGWSVEPVVARQACATATERFERPREPGEQERAAYGAAGTAVGFGAGELVQVARARGSTLLVFRRAGGGSAVVAAARGPAGPAVLWTHVSASGDGDLSLVGVYRTGAGAEAWILLGGADAPRALLVASSPDGRSWSSAGPFPLRDP